MIEQYFENFGTIDHNDRKRQGDLAFHLNWPTRTWWHRLFSTIYGVIITDAYYMYKFENKDYLEANEKLPFIKFCDKLACEMIHYKKPITGMAERNSLIVCPVVYQVGIFYLITYFRILSIDFNSQEFNIVSCRQTANKFEEFKSDVKSRTKTIKHVETVAHSIAVDVNQDLSLDFGEYAILPRCEVVNVMNVILLMLKLICKVLHIVEGLHIQYILFF